MRQSRATVYLAEWPGISAGREADGGVPIGRRSGRDGGTIGWRRL